MANREIPDDKYIIAGKPDKDRLARFLNDAKGYNRTMRDFAVLCNVEPSTFSRVLTKKITRPLKENVIQAIFINSADENLSYDRLMNANGMYKEVSEEDKYTQMDIDRRNGDISMRNTVTNRIDSLNIPYISSRFTREVFDFLDVPYAKSKYGIPFRTGRLCFGFKDQDPPIWVFYCVNVDRFDEARYVERVPREFFGLNFTELFLIDEWEPELLDSVKINFVFADEGAYLKMKDVLGGRTVNSSMSLILIDPRDEEDKTLVEEFALERRDGKQVPRFMDIKGRPGKDPDDDDWDDNNDDWAVN